MGRSTSLTFPLYSITMKKILLLTGVIVCLIGLLPFLRYIFDYAVLSDYGKGFIWGKLLILFIGISLIFISRNKRKASP